MMTTRFRSMRGARAPARLSAAPPHAPRHVRSDWDWIRDTGTWLTLATTSALIYGGAWLFCYCCFVIGFFPSGAGAADSVLMSVLLIFLAAVFAIIATFMAAWGYFLMWPLMHLARLCFEKKGPSTAPFAPLGRIAWITWFGLALNIAVLTQANGIDENEVLVLLGALIASFGIGACALKRHFDAGSGKSGAAMSGLAAGVGLVFVMLLLFKHEWSVPAMVVTQGVFAMLFISFCHDPRLLRKRRVGIPLFALLLLAAPLYLSLVYHDRSRPVPLAFDMAFDRFGLYRNAADLVVSNKSAQQLWQLSTLHGVPIQGCHLEDGTLLVSRAQVLWHGVGSRTLIRVANGGRPDSVSNGRIEIESADVRLLDPLPQQCAQLATDVHFASRSSRPIDDQELEALIADYERASQTAPRGWQITELKIRGHADPMPLGASGNLDLGLARAQAVANRLIEDFDLKPNLRRGTLRIELESSAARDPSGTPCPLKGDAAALAECHSRSRRVETQLVFRP